MLFVIAWFSRAIRGNGVCLNLKQRCWNIRIFLTFNTFQIVVGWTGQYCDRPCENHMFGKGCSQVCQCKNNATCNPTNGNYHLALGMLTYSINCWNDFMNWYRLVDDSQGLFVKFLSSIDYYFLFDVSQKFVRWKHVKTCQMLRQFLCNCIFSIGGYC